MPKRKMNSKVKRTLTKSLTTYVIPILFIMGILYVLTYSFNGSGVMSSLTSEKHKQLSQQVLQYEDEIRKYAESEGIEEYTGILLALMMQESGGRGDDPMQASESLCGSVGCIDNPERSIEHGVSYFAKTLERADEDIKLALQSYNFGADFIDFVKANGGDYSQELAIEFSAKKYDKLKHTGNYSCIRQEAQQYEACYGDIYYVNAVLDYYDGEEPLNT